MADPNIPIHETDIRYEDRAGNFVLVDPACPNGRQDVATAWEESGGRWRWRLNDSPSDGTPYPSADSRDGALEGMLRAYAADNEDVAERLSGQASRFSFGAPQIFRI